MNREWVTQGALAAGLMLASQVCGATSIVRPNVPVTVDQVSDAARQKTVDQATTEATRGAAAAAILCAEATAHGATPKTHAALTNVLGRSPSQQELAQLKQAISLLPQCSTDAVAGLIQQVAPAIPLQQAEQALAQVLPAPAPLLGLTAAGLGALSLTESEFPKSAPEQESLQIARLLWATTNGSYQPTTNADFYVPGKTACDDRKNCDATNEYLYRITRVEARNPVNCLFHGNLSFRPCFQINARLLSNTPMARPAVETWKEAHSLPSPLLSEVLYSTAKRDLAGTHLAKQPTRAELMDEILKSRRISENLAAVAVGPLFGRSDENESFTGAAAFFYPDNRGWLLGSQNFYQRMSLVVGYGSLKSTDEAIGLAGSAYAFGVGVDITPGLLLTGTLLVPDGRLTPENGVAGSGGDDSTRLMLGLSINSNILAQIGL